LLLSLVIILPVQAAGKTGKGPTKDRSQPSTDRDYQALAQAHEVTGKLVSINGTDRTFTLRVEYQLVQPNPDARKGKQGQAPQNLLRQQEQILRSRNPFERARQLQQLQAQLQRQSLQQLQAMKGAFKTVTEHKDFELEASPDSPVRMLRLPLEYDDKGLARKHTPAELKTLKGPNPNLPGYVSNFSELKPGDIVRLTLAKKNANKDSDATPWDKKPRVSMIVVVGEGPPPEQPAKEKEKKKKK
jgi:hypothetical protein